MGTESLSERYIIPPYSIIDARQYDWKERKRAWLSRLGNVAESREGKLYSSLQFRMPSLYEKSRQERERLGVSFDEYVDRFARPGIIDAEMSKPAYSGVSCFDPVLAEVIYHWFTPGPESKVFDCFAGDITKGYVACRLGHKFTGIEIREEQVKINIARLAELNVMPKYINDDGKNIGNHIGFSTQDLLITCPPYYNLENYSDNPNDLSNARTYTVFAEAIAKVIKASLDCLKSNRFAVVVTSDVRGLDGSYHNMPGDIVKAATDYGCHLWNDIVYINNDCLARLKANQYMSKRKVVRTHQRVLVFYKGRTSAIPKYFKKITSEQIEI